jgi:hypothetical protein
MQELGVSEGETARTGDRERERVGDGEVWKELKR